MHFVYICKNGPNEELRYSIRSVIKNIPNAKIMVVGGKPSWYIGPYISVPQKGGQYQNAMANLHAILDSPDIPEDFVLMNDDFFIMKPMKTIPDLYDGMLSDKVNAYEVLVPTSSYTTKLRNTKNKLNSLGYKYPLNYEIHTPFNVKKSLLKDIIKDKDIRTLWRSMYGNIHKIGGENKRDVKIYVSGPLRKITYVIDKTTTLVSTQDNVFNTEIGDQIKSRFKKPTKFESN